MFLISILLAREIVLLVLLTSCTLLNAEYKRHKVRGPPPPHHYQQRRVHPSQQFAKKWHQQPPHPQRNPVRARPMPHHKPQGYKIPLSAPPAPPRTASPPVRTFWKNGQNAGVKFPPEKPYNPPRQEKPFLAAPAINTQEFDYHIQTNNIPTTHTNPIKQVGEKGPIHTIPAPNLSPKDKPATVEEVRYQQSTPYLQIEQSNPYAQVVQQNNPYLQAEQSNPYSQVEQGHQYQVTEQPEPFPKQKLYRDQQQQLIQQQMQQQQQLQQQQQQLQQQRLLEQQIQEQMSHKQVEVQPQQLYYTADQTALTQALTAPFQKTSQGDVYLSSKLSPKELYQLIGTAYPQLQAQDAQQLQNYQALLTQQLYQPEQAFVQQSQPLEIGQTTTEGVGFRPEYQSFNYDEQAHQRSQQGANGKDFSSLVSAGYNLEPNADDTKVISDRHSLDPVAQAQLIQSYFDTRSSGEENDVEPDAKPSTEQNSEPEKFKEALITSSYYSSLPNKEAAQRLADLQVAGKINSSLMKLSSAAQQSKDQAAIFVPEVDQEDGKGDMSDDSKEQPAEYDDYSQEEGSESEEQNEFGHKLQPKN
ncbi:hypothetical protein NQ318_004254 [Aromia moschata]|uniref:Uncharacterized protein n=1 Tax=Aromia moschata TaxID=1265417 RepID=A0AAV8XR87_9CUCU|nr:hypothetical protein NQ318_004254 [Aromia moschata]